MSAVRALPSSAFRAVRLALFLASIPVSAQTQQLSTFEPSSPSLTLRTGLFLPSGGSDLFGFLTDRLTLDHPDFLSPSIGAEAGVWLGQRVQVMGGVGASQVTRGSRLRERRHDNGAAIEQTTSLRIGPTAYLGSRLYLLPLGAREDRPVRIFRGWNPFAGAGAGGLLHEFRQSGEFLDESRGVIFPAEFESKGRAAFSFLSTGVDFNVLERADLAVEARYQWSEAPLSSDFLGFDSVDLSGFGVSLGWTRRF